MNFWHTCMCLVGITLALAGCGTPADLVQPSYAPQPNQIAYMVATGPAGADLMTMHADGSQRRRLTDTPAPELFPAWSPDGSRIAFTRPGQEPRSDDGTPQSDVFVMNADGTQVRQLTAGPADDRNPSWSPDGTRLAYASTGAPEPATMRNTTVATKTPTATPTAAPTVVLPSPTVTPNIVVPARPRGHHDRTISGATTGAGTRRR